jgi:hypothetical protein
MHVHHHGYATHIHHASFRAKRSSLGRQEQRPFVIHVVSIMEGSRSSNCRPASDHTFRVIALGSSSAMSFQCGLRATVSDRQRRGVVWQDMQQGISTAMRSGPAGCASPVGEDKRWPLRTSMDLTETSTVEQVLPAPQAGPSMILYNTLIAYPNFVGDLA